MSKEVTANVQLLMSPAEVAQILSISRASLYSLMAAGLLGPEPLKLGRSTRFRRAEIIDWVNSNAPNRERWQELRGQGR